MNLKKGLVITGLAGSLVFGGGVSAFAATDYDLTQSYADSIKGASYESVLETLGEPDYVDELDMEGLGTIISATWTDADYDSLIVTTGVDGTTIESVIFGATGDLDDYSTVDADLEGAYPNIQTGMTYDEVVAVIGAEGTLGASSKASFGDNITSTSSVYSWSSDDFAILSIAFGDDGVVAKTLLTSSGEVLTDFDEGSIPSEQSNEEATEEQENNDEANNDEEADEAVESTDNDEESTEDVTTEATTEESPETDGATEAEETASVEQSVNEESTTETSNKEEQQGGKLPNTDAGISLGLLGGLAATIVGAFGLRRKD